MVQGHDDGSWTQKHIDGLDRLPDDEWRWAKTAYEGLKRMDNGLKQKARARGAKVYINIIHITVELINPF